MFRLYKGMCTASINTLCQPLVRCLPPYAHPILSGSNPLEARLAPGGAGILTFWKMKLTPVTQE